MATTRQLLELFRALGNHDVTGAADAARRIAKAEGEKGNQSAARDLLGSLNGYAKQESTQFAAHNFSGQQCVSPLPAGCTIDELELTDGLRSEIESVANEWKHRAALAKKGITRRWRLLFHGPPGCGKSATAGAIGKLTGLPVYLVKFDALIGSFLGQTALRLGEVFRFAAQQPCVLLFDEVDALAKRRGSPLEIGELDRVVIAFMQALEHANPSGFIIATCNLPERLDEALWRRFDLTLKFPKPTAPALTSYARKQAKLRGFTLDKTLAARIVKLGSYARAQQVILDEARRRALKTLN